MPFIYYCSLIKNTCYATMFCGLTKYVRMNKLTQDVKCTFLKIFGRAKSGLPFGNKKCCLPCPVVSAANVATGLYQYK